METQNGQTKPVQLIIRDLHAKIEDKEILKGVDLTVTQGETHALMGPNGSGKSTLANVIMGHPKYEVTQGEILFKGMNVLDLSPDKRARLGLFLAFQYPSSVPGVSVGNFLRRAVESRREGFDPNAPAESNGKTP
ncbi:MAG: ATP-binding cassette domain-containing protein, partial [Ktedonobacterales bacterium]